MPDIIKAQIDVFMRFLRDLYKEIIAPQNRTAVVAAAIFLSISVPLSLYGDAERSGWMRVSQLWCTSFGYNFAIGQIPFYIENISFIHQVKMFLGAEVGHSIYSARPLYSFVASFFAPFIGIHKSFLLLNWLIWAAAAFLTWRFAFKLFKDKLAALLGVLFVSGGFGFIFHLGDCSPHTMAFLAYYAGIVVIYESMVWEKKRPFKTHLFIGFYLALAYLCYDVGVPLIIGYIVLAIWRNRWWHVLLGAAIGFSAKPLWIFFLSVLTALYTGKFAFVNYYAYEGASLLAGLEAMKLRLLQSLADFVTLYGPTFFEFLLFEFLLVIGLGILSWFVLPLKRKLILFFATFFFLPIMGGIVFAAGGMSTRGYFVYGTSILLYVPLAGLFARKLRCALLVKVLAVAVLLLVVLGQFFWSTEHFRDHLGPASSYLIGFWQYVGGLTGNFFKKINFVSLTGLEPTPVMFGGEATLKQAGLYVPQKIYGKVDYHFGLAMAARLPIVLYIIGLIACASAFLRKKILLVGLAISCLLLLPAIMPYIKRIPKPLFSPMSVQVPQSKDTHLKYTITISDAFVQLLKKHASDKTKLLEVQFGMGFSRNLRLLAGEKVIAFQEKPKQGDYSVFVLEVSDFLEALKQSRNSITVEVPKGMDHGSSAFGWQRKGLPNRTFIDVNTGADWPSPNLPAFEVRLINRDNTCNNIFLVGF